MVPDKMGSLLREYRTQYQKWITLLDSEYNIGLEMPDNKVLMKIALHEATKKMQKLNNILEGGIDG